jgi:zinc D-Ala-D-Ala carboxypeptidase
MEISMQLTEHFSLEELVASDTAVRMGIDNTPNDAVLANLRQTALLGEAIRAALNEEAFRRAIRREVYIQTDSGYRCEALEKILCVNDFIAWCARHDLSPGSSWPLYFAKKAHPEGRALDFKAPVFGTPREIVEFISTQPHIMAMIDQLIMEGDWVHAAWRDNPRHEVRTATFKNGVPSYVNGLNKGENHAE